MAKFRAKIFDGSSENIRGQIIDLSELRNKGRLVWEYSQDPQSTIGFVVGARKKNGNIYADGEIFNKDVIGLMEKFEYVNEYLKNGDKKTLGCAVDGVFGKTENGDVDYSKFIIRGVSITAHPSNVYTWIKLIDD